MGDERADRHGAAGPGRGDQHHLRHRALGHVSQVHQRAGRPPDRLQPPLQPGVGVQGLAVFVAGDAEIGGPHHHAGHAVVDQGDLDPLQHVERAAGREQGPAARARGVAERQGNRRGGPRDAVDGRPALVGRPAPRGRHGGDRDLAGVLHVDGHAGLAVRRGDQAALDGEGADPGQQVAAVLRVGDDRLVHEHLQEQVVDVHARARRARHDSDLGGEGIAAAHAVDLARVGRAHHAQQEGVARRPVLRQVLGQEVAALGRAAAHPHAGDALRHTSDPWPRACRACRRGRGRARRRPDGRAWRPRWPPARGPSPAPRRRGRAG